VGLAGRGGQGKHCRPSRKGVLSSSICFAAGSHGATLPSPAALPNLLPSLPFCPSAPTAASAAARSGAGTRRPKTACVERVHCMEAATGDACARPSFGAGMRTLLQSRRPWRLLRAGPAATAGGALVSPACRGILGGFAVCEQHLVCDCVPECDALPCVAQEA